MYDAGKDYYYDVFQENKIKGSDIKQFSGFENLSEEELDKISDLIFSLAIMVKRIISE